MKQIYSADQRFIARILIVGLFLQSCYSPNIPPLVPINQKKENVSQALIQPKWYQVSISKEQTSRVIPKNQSALSLTQSSGESISPKWESVLSTDHVTPERKPRHQGSMASDHAQVKSYKTVPKPAELSDQCLAQSFMAQGGHTIKFYQAGREWLAEVQKSYALALVESILCLYT